MTLFAALAAPTNTDQGGGTGGSTSYTSSSSPPEAIQLYSNRLIDFLSGTTLSLSNPNSSSGGKTTDGSASGGEATTPKNNEESELTDRQLRQLQSRHFSALSYQAVQVRQEDVVMPSLLTGQQNQQQRHLRPDLGIWDCRVLIPDGGKGNDGKGDGDVGEKEVEASATLLRRVVVDRSSSSSGSMANPLEEGKAGDSQKEMGSSNSSAQKENENKSVRTVVISVDLTEPSEVQPTIEQMRKVILNIHEKEEKLSGGDGFGDNAQNGFTTSIKALNSSPFGKTVNASQENGEAPVSPARKSNQKQQNIALILAAIVPPNLFATSSNAASPAEAYRERQARALVLYHLNKFALEVDCTLCFVSERVESAEKDGETKEQSSGESDPLLGRNSTMSIEELGKVIRRVAVGLSPLDENEVMQTGGEGDSSKEESSAKPEEKDGDGNSGEVGEKQSSSRPPAIHVPGSHDSELIHGAYLRNASCEGRWDAGRDDLSVALPPRSLTSSKDKQTATNDNKKAASGDEEWLSKLASSVGLTNIESSSGTGVTAAAPASSGPLTPADRKKEMMKQREMLSRKKSSKGSSKKVDGKSNNEKDVSSFFENLLKK